MKKEHLVGILRGRLRQRDLVPKDILERTSDGDVIESYVTTCCKHRRLADPGEYPRLICEATCVEEFLALATGEPFP